MLVGGFLLQFGTLFTAVNAVITNFGFFPPKLGQSYEVLPNVRAARLNQDK